MRIILEIDSKYTDDGEIVIRCNSINDKVKNIENMIKNLDNSNNCFIFYKQDKEYYLSLNEILFFETDNSTVHAHTNDEIYKVTYKLYELEQLLPTNFMRISKSTIININKILSITKNITSSSIVEFKKTNKKVYVSRLYYKELKERMNERR